MRCLAVKNGWWGDRLMDVVGLGRIRLGVRPPGEVMGKDSADEQSRTELAALSLRTPALCSILRVCSPISSPSVCASGRRRHITDSSCGHRPGVPDRPVRALHRLGDQAGGRPPPVPIKSGSQGLLWTFPRGRYCYVFRRRRSPATLSDAVFHVKQWTVRSGRCGRGSHHTYSAGPKVGPGMRAVHCGGSKFRGSLVFAAARRS